MITYINKQYTRPSIPILTDIPTPPQNTKPDTYLTLKLDREQQNIVKTISTEAIDKLPQYIIYESDISILSQDEILRFGIEVSKDSIEVELSSVNDPRMGATFNSNCSTCGQAFTECPGHMGYIDLKGYFYHPEYIKLIIKILASVCHNCGKLKLTKEEIIAKKLHYLTLNNRMNEIEKEAAKLRCPSKCTSPNYIYSTESSVSGRNIYVKKEKGGGESIIPIDKVLSILKAISREDLELMGFKYPQTPVNFILRYFPVLPPTDRPDVEDRGNIYHDQLTESYKELVSNVKKYEKALKTNSKDIHDYVKAIYDKIQTIIDSSKVSTVYNSERPVLGIKQRIQGKTALIRGATMGKRVNFTARSVISPDPNLKFGQVRVPKVFQYNLTRPITVTNLNIHELTTLLRNGKVVSVYKDRLIYINDTNKDQIALKPGDIVNRCLQNGDYVLLNRQPTLYKYSMMGHEVVLGDPLTIGIHPSVTTPFNADFDGDEMNLHAVQSREALVEVMDLMNVKRCIMNVQNNKPAIGAVYDTLSGAYTLTQDTTKVPIELMYNAISVIECDVDLVEYVNRYKRVSGIDVSDYISGKALFSIILPKDLFYKKDEVLIVEGILLSGVITKDHIGTAHNSIVQVIYKQYGYMRAAMFLSDVSWLINMWLDYNPLSVSLADCMPTDPKMYEYVTKEVNKAMMMVESYGVRLNDPIEDQKREDEILGILQSSKNNILKLCFENITKDNRLRIMTLSGAKGSKINVVQIMGILGQQFLHNQRIPILLGDGLRTLPWFSTEDLDPRARGYVINSFLNGLTPAEFFFHQAVTREGLLDIALRTPETGYSINHRITKALEDIMVTYDGSVRNPRGNIFQFVYGEDGFNSEDLYVFNTKHGRQTFFININLVVDQINLKYGYGRQNKVVLESDKDVEDLTHDIIEREQEEDMED